MAYENPPFRRHDAGGRPPEQAAPASSGDQSLFHTGNRDRTELRTGAAFRNSAGQEPYRYPDSSGHQAGFDYQGSHHTSYEHPVRPEPGHGYSSAGGYGAAGGAWPGGYGGGETTGEMPAGAAEYGSGGGFGGDGFGGAGDYPTREAAPAGTAGGAMAGGDETRPVSDSELSEVFEEPDKTGRDRFAVHWLWEALLLAAVGALAFLVWRADSSALRGEQLSLVLITVTGFGLLGLSAGLSLRAAVPNLAIGPVAVAAGVYFAQNGDDGVVLATGTAAVAAVLLAVAVSVLMVLFHVPGWAATLAAATAVVVWLRLQPAEIALAGEFDPSGQAAFLFAAVAAVGTIGGLLGTMPRLRGAVGRLRAVEDPARRRGVVAALMTGVALVGSMVLAVPAGVLLVAGFQQPVAPGAPVEGSSGVTWLTWTVVGFGVALMGGTSAFGRRGGVFGTILATIALVLFDSYQLSQDWQVALLATAGGGLVGGLVVTRLVETFGKPKVVSKRVVESRSTPAAETQTTAAASPPWESTMPTRVAEATPGRHSDSTLATHQDWPSTSHDSWSSALPARPAPGGNRDPWDDDRWGRR